METQSQRGIRRLESQRYLTVGITHGERSMPAYRAGHGFHRGLVLRRLRTALLGGRQHLLALRDIEGYDDPGSYGGIRTVLIASITGGEARSKDLDAAFHPVGDHNRD
jgi:hypothetical protein